MQKRSQPQQQQRPQPSAAKTSTPTNSCTRKAMAWWQQNEGWFEMLQDMSVKPRLQGLIDAQLEHERPFDKHEHQGIFR